MFYRTTLSIAAALGFFISAAGALAQYYPDRYDRGWRDRGYRDQVDPRFSCQQRAGDLFRVPSKEVSIGRVREIRRGVFQMEVEGRGRFATCTADSRGYVLDFR